MQIIASKNELLVEYSRNGATRIGVKGKCRSQSKGSEGELAESEEHQNKLIF